MYCVCIVYRCFGVNGAKCACLPPSLTGVARVALVRFHTVKVAWNVWSDVTGREDIARLNISFPYGPMPDKYQFLIRQSYYAATTYMDSLVGELLSALDNLGLAHNTIVTLHSDHGWALGEHQEWAKYSNFEVVTRVPLMVYVPRPQTAVHQQPIFPYINVLKSTMTHQKIHTNAAITGLKSEALVELVDLFPSLADLAGLAPIPTCPVPSNHVDLCTEGYSFAPLILDMLRNTSNAELSWKKAVFSQYPRPSFYPQADSYYTLLKDIRIMGYSMRSSTYRYTEWVQFNHTRFGAEWNNVYARELYMHQTDPSEDINRAYEHGYEELVQTASYELHQGWSHALP